jgi:hypothetical protein
MTNSCCSVRKRCKASDPGMSDSVCSPWSLLTNICSQENGENMNELAGCRSYSALCQPKNTVVQQCSTKGIPNFVSTAVAINDVSALCFEMPDMPECDMCRDANSPTICPDPLLTLGAICLSMWMADCANWERMCPVGTNGLVPFCGGSASSSDASPITTQCRGSMIMYFHHGYQGALLPSPPHPPPS